MMADLILTWMHRHSYLVTTASCREMRTSYSITILKAVIKLLCIPAIILPVMAMGMMMLSPLIVSLPFKLMLFVLIDGWSLTIGTLTTSIRGLGLG